LTNEAGLVGVYAEDRRDVSSSLAGNAARRRASQRRECGASLASGGELCGRNGGARGHADTRASVAL
jgi:hypothetical protein